MSRTRDKYDPGLTPKQREQQEAEQRHRRQLVRSIMCAYMAAHVIWRAVCSDDAETPGTWANTVLQAFVASDPAGDSHAWHDALVPQFRVLRKMAWRALSGVSREIG